MCLVEVPLRQGEVLQATAPETARGPVDVGHGAGPVQFAEEREARLREMTVEPGVVRHEHRPPVQQARDLLVVDPLSPNHVVRDTGERHDLGRELASRVLEAIEGLRDVHDAAGLVVVEDEQRQFDDPIVGHEPRRLDVEVDAFAHPRPRARCGRIVQPLVEAAQHAVPAGRLELGDYRLPVAVVLRS